MGYSVLVTGANRGIGKDVVKLYLSRPETTVIAAVRDPSHPSVDDVRSFPSAVSSRLIVVKIDAASPSSAVDAIKTLKSQRGVTQLDTVIANAGIGKYWGLIADTPVHEVEDHLQVNSVGPFALYLAVQELLLVSPKPRYVVISTELGSIGMQSERKIKDVAYGMSKAAVNFFVGKLHHEEDRLIAFPIHPGWVKTGLGNAIAETLGMTEAPVTQEESAAGIFEQVENSSKETTSGKFITYKGKEIPW